MTLSTTTLLQTLLEEQKQYVDFFFQHLNLEQVEKIVQICLSCKGLVVLTGVGKSGIVAEKIAMTLVSTGTRSLYLPASNFLHGDIGAITPDDIVIVLSKSGRTQELVDLIPFLRKKKCLILGAISEEGSPLEQLSDQTILLPVEKELCPFDLAPTISTTVQLLFGDLIAMALMREKGISLEEYAGNHPSGSIGKKTCQVKDLMKTGDDLPICGAEDRVIDVIVELSNKRCGCLLISNSNQELLGIFTEGDLGRALKSEGIKAMEKPIKDFMTRSPIVVQPNLLISMAIQKMQDERYVMMAPVVENNKIVGIIHMHDIVHEGM